MKNLKQNTSDLIMIEPMHFGFNTETAEDNHYKIKDDLISKIEIKQKAIKEFNELVKKIKEENISVRVFGDEKNIITTDSVFPNNWISLHKDGKLILYPMNQLYLRTCFKILIFLEQQLLKKVLELIYVLVSCMFNHGFWDREPLHYLI